MSLALTAAPTRPVPLPARPRRGARAGELLLADVLEREARAPQGRIAVVVRLSRLPPPGPRPYHRRVARALLEDCAQRHGGQVLQLSGGDLVLVAPPPPRQADATGGPLAMPGLIARLLHMEEQGAEPAAFAVTLAEGAERLRALLDDTATPHVEEEAVARPRNPFAGRLSPGFAPLAPDALARLLSGSTAELLQRHAVARLPARGEPAAQVRTTHQMLGVDAAQLAARLAHRDGHAAPHAGADLPADPWLARHIDTELGRAVLVLLRQAWGSGTPTDAAPRPGAPPLLLRLPLGVLASEDFAAFVALPHGPARPAVAVSMAEAAADARGFAAMRAMLRAAGMTLVLDGLTHHALVLARPEVLEPDLVALAWSTALPRLADARRAEVADAVARIGPARLLLTGADSEPALRWGRTLGIQLFQGAHVDAMLAATRQLACPHAGVCGLRACTQRAIAATAVGRAGCARPDLLDGLDAAATLPRLMPEAHARP